MYFLILILSILINLLFIQYFYKKALSKINDPEKRYNAEINSLTIEFNKTAKNNLDLLEEKVEEIKNLLLLADSKSSRIDERNKPEASAVSERTSDNVVKLKGSSKSSIIKKLVHEGKNSRNISKIMGISQAEVELYIHRQKK